MSEIVTYIARDNPEKAKEFGHGLIDKPMTLAALPERGRIVPELEDPSVREIVHGSYRIIYEIFHDPDAVYVIRFWHGARGTPKIEQG